MRKKIYVGCSLTQAPAEFRQKVELLKDSLRKEFEVLDFLGLTLGTPEDVYRHDIYECVAECDLFVAICDLPSIGLGWELGAASLRFKKRVLAVAHVDAHITRLALGCDEPAYEFLRYRELEEIVDMVRARLREPICA